jgi:hypothetical protein
MPDTTSTTTPNAQAAPAAGPPVTCRVAAVPGTGSTAANGTREP